MVNLTVDDQTGLRPSLPPHTELQHRTVSLPEVQLLLLGFPQLYCGPRSKTNKQNMKAPAANSNGVFPTMLFLLRIGKLLYLITNTAPPMPMSMCTSSSPILRIRIIYGLFQ